MRWCAGGVRGKRGPQAPFGGVPLDSEPLVRYSWGPGPPLDMVVIFSLHNEARQLMVAFQFSQVMVDGCGFVQPPIKVTSAEIEEEIGEVYDRFGIRAGRWSGSRGCLLGICGVVKRCRAMSG